MARIQILELPEGTNDERPPFAVIIDQADDDLYADLEQGPTDAHGEQQSLSAHLATELGARAVLCFHGTIEIPANDTSAYVTPTMVIRVEGDADSGSADLAEQIRHGIERAQAAHYGRTA